MIRCSLSVCLFAALPASGAPFYWNSGIGSGDGVSIYQEANWTTSEDGAGTAIPLINPGTPVSESSDLVVNSGTPGGGSGGVGTLDLNGGSLLVNGGTLRFNTGNGAGISNGTLTQNGGVIIAHFLGDSTVVLNAGVLELHGEENPLSNVTLNFAGESTAVLRFVNESPSDVRNEHLGKFRVAGQPAVENMNIVLAGDAAAGTLVSLASAGNGQDSDGDLLADSEERTIHGTDPFSRDSDGDGTPDGLEVARGLDPTNAGERMERPNIIFILVDDLGYGDLGVLFQNGKPGKKHRTPHLDQMAADGMILDRHYTPAPVCAPCRSSLMLGVHQGHANVRDNQFDKALENNHTLATTLREAGYATSLVGKWGLQGNGGTPAAWEAYPTKRGFDYFYGYVRHSDGHTHYPAHVTDSRGRKELYDQNTMVRDGLDRCYTADLFTARAKKLIIDHQNGNRGQPFFICLAYDTPHAALQLPTVAYPAGGGTAGGLQWLGIPGRMINTAVGTIDSYRHPDYTRGVGNSWTDVEERFATSVRRLDDCVGDLRRTLLDLDIADDTIIVFTSDNGPHTEDYLTTAQTNDGSSYSPRSFDSYGPFEGTKRDSWEGGIRMPALVVWPGTIPAGTVDTTPSQMHDWMPTFCELAGWTAPSRTDGTSLVPLLTGAGPQDPPLVYVEYFQEGSTSNYGDFANHGGDARGQAQAIFLDGYKGVRNAVRSHATDFRIYDPATDVSEGNDLAGTSTFFNELQQRMKDTVLRIRQVDGSAPRPYDNELVPAISPAVEPGISYKQYEGLWPWLPEFESLGAVGEGMASGLDVAHLSRTDEAGLLYTGFVSVPSPGWWTFYLDSDAGTHLRIHDSQVIDGDFNYEGAEQSGTIRLEAGLHPFRLYYRTRRGVARLGFSWSGPGTLKEDVPEEALFREGVPSPEPVALDDFATTTGGPVVIPILANDSDDGAPSDLSIRRVGAPAGGVVRVLGSQIRYTPLPEFFGTDAFSYEITDGEFTAGATVTVAVNYQGADLWIPLNECAGDAVHEAGGVRLGVLSGAGVTRVDGRHGKALMLDGVDDQVDLAGLSEELLPTGDAPRTIMCWVRVEPGRAFENQTMFGYGQNVPGQRFSFRLNGSRGDPVDQELRLEVQGGSIRGTTALDDGQWHHVAAVCDDFNNDGTLNVNEVKLYVDGFLERMSGSAPRVMNTAAGTIARLGGSNHSENYNFVGEIDELRLFPVAMSAAEVRAQMLAGNEVANAWHRRNFGGAEIDWSADRDGDRLSRLAEYAFGGNPFRASRTEILPRIVYVGETGKLEMTFRRRVSGSHELSYRVEMSENLADWSPLDGQEIRSEVISADGCLEDVTFEAAGRTPRAGRLFLRASSEFAP